MSAPGWETINGAEELGPSHTRAIPDTVRTPLLVLDGAFTVRASNPSFHDTFGLPAHEITGLSLFALGDGQREHPELRSPLERVLPERTEIRNLPLRLRLRGQGVRGWMVNARRVHEERAAHEHILLSIEDVTEGERLRRRAESYVRHLEPERSRPAGLRPRGVPRPPGTHERAEHLAVDGERQRQQRRLAAFHGLGAPRTRSCDPYRGRSRRRFDGSECSCRRGPGPLGVRPSPCACVIGDWVVVVSAGTGMPSVS